MTDAIEIGPHLIDGWGEVGGEVRYHVERWELATGRGDLRDPRAALDDLAETLIYLAIDICRHIDKVNERARHAP